MKKDIPNPTPIEKASTGLQQLSLCPKTWGRLYEPRRIDQMNDLFRLTPIKQYSFI